MVQTGKVCGPNMGHNKSPGFLGHHKRRSWQDNSTCHIPITHQTHHNHISWCKRSCCCYSCVEQKNFQALGLIQGTISPALWPDFTNYDVGWTGEEVWKGGGASTYLQLVNMVKIQFINSTDLLPQVQEFQQNYVRILSNGHSALSEDLTMFTFCCSLPELYQDTTQKYINNILDIALYKLQTIINQVIKEEARRKAHFLASGSLLNKFSMVNNLSHKCAQWGMMNHSTQNHWPGGKHPQRGKRKTPKASSSLGNKKKSEKKGKGKGKEHAKDSLNVLSIVEVPDMSTFSSKLINLYCYIKCETVEQLLDSGCTEHITPVWSDFLDSKHTQPIPKCRCLLVFMISLSTQSQPAEPDPQSSYDEVPQAPSNSVGRP